MVEIIVIVFCLLCREQLLVHILVSLHSKFALLTSTFCRFFLTVSNSVISGNVFGQSRWHSVSVLSTRSAPGSQLKLYPDNGWTKWVPDARVSGVRNMLQREPHTSRPRPWNWMAVFGRRRCNSLLKDVRL